MDTGTIKNDPLLKWSELFLAGGGSALLLSIAHLHHRLWFLSFIALVPYLWKLKHTDFRGSIMLGTLLAVCFSFVVFINDLALFPSKSVFKLLVLISIFSIFGAAVNRIKIYVGFYPVFIATLWIPLEYFLIKRIGCGLILDFSHVDSGLLFRLSSLIGLLTVSYFIMLINSLILLMIENAVFGREHAKAWSHSHSANCRFNDPDIGIQGLYYALIDSRAPPLGS